MKNKVVLFDIDWTLVKGGTGKVFIESHRVGMRKVFGIELEQDFDITPHEGKVGKQFLRDLAIERGIDPVVASERALEAINATDEYLLKNAGKLKTKVILGVRECIDELRKMGVLLGLLTGNSKTGAKIKLESTGLFELFTFGAFGDESFKRAELVELARKRAEEISGHHISNNEIFIVGDSPRDIECGREAGVKTIAVATGPNTFEKLQLLKPDLLIRSLEEKDTLISFLKNNGKINP